MRLKHAICNEIYKDWKFNDACRSMKKAGYEGIEIAPFTLKENPAEVSATERAEYKRIMADAGLEFVGLHWLMVSPKGLHVTTPNAGLRAKSWEHIRSLIDLCADLGPNGLMVFGSPFQRSTVDGATREQATNHYVEGLASVAGHAEQHGVTILVEALPLAQSDVITTLAEAVSIVERINSAAVRTMFDTHNAADETEPHAALVDRYYGYIRHVHVNEMDGRHCGTADYDFAAIFDVLRRRGYNRWVSLEAFDFTPGAETIAVESIAHLNREWTKVAGA